MISARNDSRVLLTILLLIFILLFTACIIQSTDALMAEETNIARSVDATLNAGKLSTYESGEITQSVQPTQLPFTPLETSTTTPLPAQPPVLTQDISPTPQALPGTEEAANTFQEIVKTPAIWYNHSAKCPVTGLNIFVRRGNDQQYGRRFSQDTVDKVGYQIVFRVDPSAGCNIEGPVTAILVFPDGMIYRSTSDNYKLVETKLGSTYWGSTSGSIETSYYGEWVWEKPDKYPTGEYQLDIIIEGIKVASANFKIY